MTAFLDHFPQQVRGAVNGFFVSALRRLRRDGEDVSEVAVCRAAYVDLRNRIRDGIATELHSQVLERMRTERDLALAHATEVLRRENRSPEERKAEQTGSAREGVRQWMANRAPTEAQLGYLHTLGHREDAPRSMLEASEIIDRLKRERAA